MKERCLAIMYWNLLTNKIVCTALTGVAQLVGCRPAEQKVAGSLPGQDTCLAVGPVPGWGAGCVTGNREMFLSHTNVSLPLFLPPFSSL